MKPILDKINQQAGLDLVKLLATGISGSALNSLLLQVFDQKTRAANAAALLRAYESNRLVKPATIDPLLLRKIELDTLQVAKSRGFTPVELSPVTVLGTCSVLATVSQQKVISALRGTEVVADATNALALYAAARLRSGKAPKMTQHYCTTQRQIRTQPPVEKEHTAHFSIACLVSAGKDKGGFLFEKESLRLHFQCLQQILEHCFGITNLYFKLLQREGYCHPGLLDAIKTDLETEFPVRVEMNPVPNGYYEGLQYKVAIEINGLEMEIADGGFVNWTRQLLQNNKERFLITGLGLEWLCRLSRSRNEGSSQTGSRGEST